MACSRTSQTLPWAEGPNRPVLSVAPMMAWTDHHYRQMLRMLTKSTLLYTEMYPVDAVHEAAAHSQARLDRLLAFDPSHHPLAVQLGGNDPVTMGRAAALCAQYGYVEVNINVGCPSETVSGACVRGRNGGGVVACALVHALGRLRCRLPGANTIHAFP